MADEKKPDAKDAKPAPAPEKKDEFVEIVSIIVVIMLVMSIVNGIVNFVHTSKIFANGWAGLTPKGILLSHTRPIASLLNPTGARVISVQKTDVYNSPDGTKIGTQNAAPRGKILQGPVEIDGNRYWYVDYDSGPDGWVKESDIAYLESEPNFAEMLFIRFFNFIIYIKIFLALVAIAGILFCVHLFRKISELRANEAKLLYPQSPEIVKAANPQWERILARIDSPNDSEWRQAILEADIMLADILDRLSLPGDTIGDKLKAVEKSDFTTIDNAWEGHKIRNQIAHEGSSFMLTAREAKRVIGLYQTVFEEFELL